MSIGLTISLTRVLSVLEASYVVVRVPPWHANLGKRDAAQKRTGVEVVPWSGVADTAW